MLKLEVDKKYRDTDGRVWEIINVVSAATSLSLYEGTSIGEPLGFFYSTGLGFGTAPNLVSEVPTTPQFKVGDRVSAVVDNYGIVGVIRAVREGKPTRYDIRDTRDDNYIVLEGEIRELLTDDTTPTYVPTCTCETFLLMRSGCSCGHARVAIEQEFKQRGWK